MKNNKKIILIVIIFTFNFSYSQQKEYSTFSGTIKDKFTGLEVSDALVLLTSPSRQSPLFIYTDINGGFILKTEKDSSYFLNVKHLNYEDYSFEFTDETSHINVQLIPTENTLEDVVILVPKAFIVKKDTIIYNADFYRKQSDRKLKDILKKLPGIHVDRNGNVTSNGKSVKKLLVEGKTFFTGDEKLGVNNIPANAVEEIQLLDNYNDIAILKEFEDTDEIVINVKLKENKKRFFFGDVDVGFGVKRLYKLNPAIFYYSPKQTVNTITDINNIGKRAFTIKDYIDFNGGILNIAPSEYFKLSNDDFSQFLSSTNYTSSKDRFLAGSYNNNFKENSISSYVIHNNYKTESYTSSINKYIQEGLLFESRENSQQNNNRFLISKIDVEHKPNTKTDVRMSLLYKNNKTHSNSDLTSTINNENTILFSNSIVGTNQLKGEFFLTKLLNKNNVFVINSTLNSSKSKRYKYWNTNRAILSEIINLQEDDEYGIVQEMLDIGFDINTTFKHYWKWNKEHQLNTSLSLSYYTSKLNTLTFQELTNNSINMFDSELFNADTNYKFTRTELNTEYKWVKNNLEVVPALTIQYNSQKITQENNYKQAEFFLLPRLDLRYLFNNSEKLHFSYNRNIGVPSINQISEKYYLSSFNSLILGNPKLDFRTINKLSLRYYKFNLFKGLQLNASMSYNIKENGSKATTQFYDIDQVQSFISFNRNEKELSLVASASKSLKILELGVDISHSSSKFYQISDNDVILNNSLSSSFGMKIKTLFNDLPTIYLSFNKDINNYQNDLSSSCFITNKFSFDMEYEFYENYYCDFGYNYSLYINNDSNQKTIFNNINASFKYSKESSSFQFEITGTNLLNTKYKRTNNFSEFLITDTRVFVQPRMLLLSISYKL